MENEADLEIAKRILPAGLRKSIEYVFSSGLQDVMLVGGTALSGYYAGHRRSDDMDLFVKTAFDFKATVLSVKSLAAKGVLLDEEQSTAQYSRFIGSLDGHSFTIDVVLDENIYTAGSFIKLKNAVQVATLETLLKMKCATLVSRCSEKDLFDLCWLFGHMPTMNIDTMIRYGKAIDGGVNAEMILHSLISNVPMKASCGFGFQQSASEILQQIEIFRNALIQEVDAFLSKKSTTPLDELVRRLRNL